MECRSGCGACCIAPSITGGFYGMPGGKPAGVACVHLNEAMGCSLFGDPRRPTLCERFSAEADLCGTSRQQAMSNLELLEVISLPEAES